MYAHQNVPQHVRLPVPWRQHKNDEQTRNKEDADVDEEADRQEELLKIHNLADGGRLRRVQRYYGRAELRWRSTNIINMRRNL